MTADREPGRRLKEVLEMMDPEALAEELGRELLRDPDHPSWSDARFLDWLATEERAGDRHERGISDDDFRRRGEEFMARAQAKRLRMRREYGQLIENREEAGALVRPRRAGEGPVPVVELGIAAGVGRELWDEPVEAWIEVPSDIPEGQYVALKIVGESMAPLMHTGDIVLVRLGPEVQRDTVIVARHPEDGYVCKRVSRVRGETVELTSIESGRPIIVVPRDPSCIIGRVVLVWHQNSE
jgi:SOS-response transcriptional repressor LexA